MFHYLILKVLDKHGNDENENGCAHLLSLTKYHEYINPLNTKRRLLYLKTQFVPCSKHFFISVIKTNQFTL